MDEVKKEAPVATEAEYLKISEKNRESIMATKILTSEELQGLSNTTIALKLFFLIENGTEKDFNAFREIGLTLGSIAVQKHKLKSSSN